MPRWSVAAGAGAASAAVLLLVLTGCAELPPANELRLDKERIRFDPNSTKDLQRLDQKTSAIVALDSNDTSKKNRRGLQQIHHLAQKAIHSKDERERSETIGLLLETVAAVNNNQRTPLPEHFDGFQFPGGLYNQLHRPVGCGTAPATNLQPGTETDLSRLDPVASTFWRRPKDIAGKDLSAGFGRSRLPRMEETVWNYSAPKESYGTHGGFEAESRNVVVKLKFGEISSEPFVTRIFDALGFHADATDYVPEVKVRYDRRIFTEFNLRHELTTRFTVLWVIPTYTMHLQKHYDPFAFMAWAVLRDGRRWTSGELKTNLFLDATRAHPEDDAANFRREVETNLDYLITVPANVQVRNPLVKSIGPWDYGQLGHADRRELRGAGLLAAWLGFFDSRFDNTRLRVVEENGHKKLVHYFSDLGGGLSRTTGVMSWGSEEPNDFPWTFTRPPLWQGKGKLARPLRITGFKPIADTPPFAAMTIDDARWMARLIGQLTERQIVDALTASGYDAAEVRLYTEKLLCRRDHMMSDLGLAGEFPPLRPAGVDQRFSYDPPAGRHQVVEGRLELKTLR